MTQPDEFHLDPADHAAVRRQLGRPPRGAARVAHWCPCGLPAVLETFPLVDGAPFPTLYWLTCVRARAAIGRLESDGRMREVNERLRTDPAFAEAFRRAQEDYVRRRDALHPLEGAGGIGGGPLDRVKCLHAHYAHHAVCRCNPVGTWIEGETGSLLAPPPCVESD